MAQELYTVDMPLTKGIYGHLTNSEYRALEGISISSLKEIAKSPAHFLEKKLNPQKPTDEMVFGTAFHAAILEPESFKENYARVPKIDKRTNAGKAQWEKFVLEHGKKIPLDDSDFTRIEKMVESVHKNKTAIKLLSGGKAEQSVFWKCPITDVLCKARPDYLHDSGLIVDVKTSKDASKGAFLRSITKFGYHLQSAFYLEGVGINLNKTLNDFVHLVVEKEPPYSVGIYVLDDPSIAEASKEIRRLIDIYSECVKNNNWPGYAEEILSITMPRYLFGGDNE